MSKIKKLHCQYCGREAIKVNGLDIYPHRPDLGKLSFYQCKHCDAYVGTHNGTNKPLGTLANKNLRMARGLAHKSFDPLWKYGKLRRKDAYIGLSKFMGINVNVTHIALFNLEQCYEVVKYSEL